MSGHSRWATIRRKKGAVDAKRGQVFTKLVREITTAVRLGGGDPNGNPRLRAAIMVAKSQSMTGDTIERGIKKGLGTLDGPAPEEIMYEGYGPGGVAFLVEAQTDNRNRTSAEVRNTFSKSGGNLGASGSVAYMFEKRAQIVFDAGKVSEDRVMEVALDAGASDVTTEDDSITVYGDWKSFADLLECFEREKMTYASAEIAMIPENTVAVSGDDAERLMKLMEKLEELDDVQKVYANFDIDEATLAKMA